MINLSMMDMRLHILAGKGNLNWRNNMCDCECECIENCECDCKECEC